MTEWILKLFVKDYKNAERPSVRSAIGKTAGGVAIGVNVLLSLLKILAGAFLLGGSVSVIADGVNNLSDAASGLISLLGFKLAEKPADAEHPYGHGRYEYLSGLMVALLILVIGVELLKSSVVKIFSPGKTGFSLIALSILLFSILGKLWLMYFNRNLSLRIHSETLRATSADSRNDVITTLSVLIAALISRFTGFDLDGYIGAAVALFILYSGYGLVKSTIDPLLGKAPDQSFIDHIEQKVLSYEGVLGTHDLMVHDYGPGRQFASIHVEISADIDALKGHELIDRIEQDFKKEGLSVVIHYDPICNSDSELGEFRLWLEQEVKKIDPSLSIHDIRMVPCATHTNLIFDCMVPSSSQKSDRQVKEELTTIIRDSYPAYLPVIHIDRSYLSTK
ncbi:MAG TPA: cation-efflux pump [Clostridiales bacterium]|nr:cation-efflux pump [Clostridiales bacterium]